MGGSQLKRLKATLKTQGLTGQTNIKKKGKKRSAPVDSRRDDREQVIQNIRDEFNPFEVKVNRKKFDIQDARADKKGAAVAGRPGLSKQIGEEERRAAYEHHKARKSKVGTLVDRRFGENDQTLSLEDKMLERFTREKQRGASKRSLFNLDDDDDEYGDNDDDENGGFTLTHSGKSLAADFDSGDLGLDDESGKKYHNEEDEETRQPPKKKTKAEVMKEVIAKSKFYKHERQKQKATLESKISELNEGFDDVMAELRGSATSNNNSKPAKDPKGFEYAQQMRKLNMERRAAPAERTKTEEELEKERTENKKKLEDARLRRMEGMDRGEALGDDLDDGFWEQNSDEEGVSIEKDEGEEEEEEEESDGEADSNGRSFKNKSISGVTKCPESHEELLAILKDQPHSAVVSITKSILNTYKIHLAQRNKELIGIFIQVIVEHILYLADSTYSADDYTSYVHTQEELIKIVKTLASKFVVPMTEGFREHIADIQGRLSLQIENSANGEFQPVFPKTSDMVFFTLVGVLYSTSDHYHLIVTPVSILMCQSINQLKAESSKDIAYGLFVSDLLLQYQRISKRYIPEVTAFLESALLLLHPDPKAVRELSSSLTVPVPKQDQKELRLDSATIKKISNKNASSDFVLKISDLDSVTKLQLFVKLMDVIDRYVTAIWRDKAAFIEISRPFTLIVSSLIKTLNIASDASSPVAKKLLLLSGKFLRLGKFAAKEHKPLQLQSHKPVAIATYAPKFEENYNPEKKSYDPDRQRQEISKIKAQIKKERKLTVRELRKDNKFMAREQIKGTKTKYADYHKKMASIINSINTVEGTERNQYDKERRRSKNKK